MPFHMPLVRCLAVAGLFLGGLFLGTALTSTASAQDVMELDLAFKSGLLQAQGPEGNQEGRPPQEQRHDTRAAQGWLEAKKHRVRRRR
ncbi:MAG: hypothetical protein WA773_21680 [Bradyrhizobium sp.]